jgi:P-type E1-E2 ATPase
VAPIVSLVSATLVGKERTQRLVDWVSAVFVPTVMAIAVVPFVGWWLTGGDPTAGLLAAVAVLIVACPCLFGLATPVAIMVVEPGGARVSGA